MVIEECIDVAAQAPTGLNREHWRFLVITDPEPKRALGAIYRRAFEASVATWRELAAAAGEPEPPVRPTYRELADRIDDRFMQSFFDRRQEFRCLI